VLSRRAHGAHPHPRAGGRGGGPRAAAELAAGGAGVKSAKSIGVRTATWRTRRQALALLNVPDIATAKGLRAAPSSRRAARRLRCAGPRWRRLPMGAFRADSRWRRRPPHGTRMQRQQSV